MGRRENLRENLPAPARQELCRPMRERRAYGTFLNVPPDGGGEFNINLPVPARQGYCRHERTAGIWGIPECVPPDGGGRF